MEFFMSHITLFSIKRTGNKNDPFESLIKTWRMVAPPKTVTLNKRQFIASLYNIPDRRTKNKELSWDWVYKEFDSDPPIPKANPRDVLIIDTDLGKRYCVSFGTSFLSVDKYCDRDFAFNFAKKIPIKATNTTTTCSPGQRRNKTMSTFTNQTELDHESNEAYLKIKLTCNLSEDFKLFRPTVAIGQSICFDIGSEDNTLLRITQLIDYVEEVLNTYKDKNDIPRLFEIKDLNLLQELDNILINKIETEEVPILGSELDIYGSTEIINNADQKYCIQYKRHRLDVSEINWENIKTFCEKFSLSIDRQILDFKVTYYKDDHSIFTKKIKELIEFICDEKKAYLSQGIWYQFNDDFINSLNESVSRIPTEYCRFADIDRKRYQKIINEKIAKAKLLEENVGKSEEDLANSISNKNYTEWLFNQQRQKEGYQLLDRVTETFDGHPIEVADLYKDGELISVKIGGGSGKLCYTVDQSLIGLKYYQSHKASLASEVHTVAIWFVLTRSPIEDSNRKPDLRKLKMLSLKMRLDGWARDVRNNYMTPKIYISYIR